MDKTQNMQNQPVKIDYLGPARQHFDTLDQLAGSYLDTFCPGWQCIDTNGIPRNHLIPSIFRFDKSELSDTYIQNLKPDTSASVIKSRHGDESEYLVHRSIHQLVIDGIAAPFVAIANINPNNKLKFMKSIFSHIQLPDDFQWVKSECDFLLIGPKIGVIIIEVKGFQYDPHEHFRSIDTILPKEFSKGLDQLQNFEEFIKSCHKFAQTPPIQSKNTRKILFLPKVSEKAYTDWKNSSHLRPETKKILSERTESIMLIFGKTDDSSQNIDFPETLAQILKNSSEFQISPEIYKWYTKLFAGIATMTGTETKIQLKEEDFNKAAALNMEYLRIKYQNPMMKGLKLEENPENQAEKKPKAIKKPKNQAKIKPSMGASTSKSTNQIDQDAGKSIAKGPTVGKQFSKPVKTDPRLEENSEKLVKFVAISAANSEIQDRQGLESGQNPEDMTTKAPKKPRNRRKASEKGPKIADRSENRSKSDQQMGHSENSMGKSTDNKNQHDSVQSIKADRSPDQNAQTQKNKMPNAEGNSKDQGNLDHLSLVPAENIPKIGNVLQKLSIMLLSPEQQSILTGDNNQILIGMAGTGKTILLQAKALELLEKGESIRVIAPLNLRLEYKTLFDHFGYKNIHFFDWRMWIESFRWDVTEIRSKIKGHQINDQESKQRSETENQRSEESDFTENVSKLSRMAPRLLKSVRKGVVPSDNLLWQRLCHDFLGYHVFIDEASASFTRREYLYTSLALVAMMRTKNPEKTAWMAFDPKWYDRKRLTDLGEILKQERIPISFLHHVLRSSQEVFNACHANVYDSIKMGRLGLSKLQLGHKIQGIPPIIHEQHFGHAREAACHLFKVALPEILKGLNLHNLPVNSIGVVVFGKLMSHHAVMTEITKLFSRFCLTADFPAPMVANQDESRIYLRELSKHHPKPQNWSTEMKDQFVSVEIPPGIDFPAVNTPIVVCSSTQALSLEWPLVIILSIIPKGAHGPHTVSQRYLARSRAVVTFIELFYTFDRDSRINNRTHLKDLGDNTEPCGCSYCLELCSNFGLNTMHASLTFLR